MNLKNAVLWMELRVRIREKKLWIVSFIFLVCLLGMSMVPMVSFGKYLQETEPAYIGSYLLNSMNIFLLVLLLILGPLAGAGRITQEREQRTLSSLLNTPLRRWQIVLGKLMGTWIYVTWLAFLSLPFFACAWTWGGCSLREAGTTFVLILCAGYTMSAVAIGMSGYFNRTLNSYLGTGAFLFFWLAAFPLFGTLINQFWRPTEPAAAAKMGQWISYIFYKHNPFVIVMPRSLVLDYRFPLSVWLGLCLLSFSIAVRGLKRGCWGQA